jgi:hypothetical protein
VFVSADSEEIIISVGLSGNILSGTPHLTLVPIIMYILLGGTEVIEKKEAHIRLVVRTNIDVCVEVAGAY